MGSFWAWIAKWWEGSDTAPVDEAKQQRLSKSNKLQTAYEATMTQHMNKIANDEIAAVRQYKDQTVFGGKVKQPNWGKTDDEMIIADDIRITNVRPSVLPALMGAVAGAGLLWLAIPHLLPDEEPDVPEPSSPVVERMKDVFDYEVDTWVTPPP